MPQGVACAGAGTSRSDGRHWQDWLALLGRIAIPSIALVAGGGLSAYARNRFQTAHLFAPDRYPLGFWNPEAHGLPAEDDWFEAEDGARLHGWWIPHPMAWGTILYCHGNNGNITNRIEAFQNLRRLGVNLFAFDYRGYGRSEGEPTEAGALSRRARGVGPPGRQARARPEVDPAVRPLAGRRGRDRRRAASRGRPGWWCSRASRRCATWRARSIPACRSI